MGTFERPLRLTYIDGCDWEVYEAFTYTTDLDGLTITITVPAGTLSDFASIPRFFWRVMPPVGKYGKAALIHDAIYRSPEMPFTREQADRLFLGAMHDLGVNAVTRQVMYRAVRLFGGRAYRPRSSQPTVRVSSAPSESAPSLEPAGPPPSADAPPPPFQPTER